LFRHARVRYPIRFLRIALPLPQAIFAQILTSIDRLYAAALDESKWHSFLETAAAMLNAGNAYVSEIAHDKGSLEYIVLRPMDWNAVSVDRYAALMDEDPRMPAFRENPYRPLHCRMVVSEKKLHASRTYREALKPLGIEYTLVVGVPRAHEITNFLGFTRSAGARPFDMIDCEAVSELVPHLARAFQVRHALGLKQTVPALPAPESLEAQQQAREQLLKQRFGLSTAETRLTLLLMTGRTVRESAEVLGITEGSARQYLGRIFNKTDVHRQVDLIRMVGDALAWNC
jgi:DNA-binding CsgD family transcriptional regulator